MPISALELRIDCAQHLGVEADPGHRNKQTLTCAARPDWPRFRVGDHPGQLSQIARHANLVRQHVAGSKRQHRHRPRRGEQTIDHFVDGAVPAGRHDQMEDGVGLTRQPFGVAGRAGRTNLHDTSQPFKLGDDPMQPRGAAPRRARHRIEDDQNSSRQAGSPSDGRNERPRGN